MVEIGMQHSTFTKKFKGRFFGILHWNDLDAFWLRVIAEPEGWYASLTGAEPAEQPLSAETLKQFVGEVDSLLRLEHDEKYCGIVYSDDLDKPTFIKIYDPNNLGGSCGVHAQGHPPRWLLTRLRPERIAEETPLPGGRRRWWQAMFG